MGLKIVAINGSPHTNGNVTYALSFIKEGVHKNNGVFVQFNLSKLNINNCIGCRKCVENGGNCVLSDDMKTIFEEIKTAEILIIASPIYICQVNGFTKTFLDRLYPLTDEKHKPRFGTRKLYMLYTYGAPIPLIFNKYISYTGKSLKAMGLLIHKNIVISGCTTLTKVKNDNKLKDKLMLIGEKL